MCEEHIPEATMRPSSEVIADASFAEVVQYADWYVAGRGDTEHDYRYSRYYNVLKNTLNSMQIKEDTKIAHIDIGCGPGLFAWTLLDWAEENEIDYDKLSLYGYDCCTEMIRLARKTRMRLLTQCPAYPDLYYGDDYAAFLSGIATMPHVYTDYLITLGHVLAGNHNPDDISGFAGIIEQIVQLKNPSDTVWLLSSDATSDRHRPSSLAGWNALLAALKAAGIACTSRLLATGRSSDWCVLLSQQEV